MQFFEHLSTAGITCPHEDAFIPDGATVYYRRVRLHPPSSECFRPNDRFAAPDGCIQKSVSLFDNLQGLINAACRTPAGKKKRPYKIASVVLTPTCGRLKQTFSAGHHSWWRSATFNPQAAIPQTVEA